MIEICSGIYACIKVASKITKPGIALSADASEKGELSSIPKLEKEVSYARTFARDDEGVNGNNVAATHATTPKNLIVIAKPLTVLKNAAPFIGWLQ